MSTRYVGTLAMASAVCCFMSGTAWAQGSGVCTRTAEVAFKACGFGVQDDLWIAEGNCDNLTDPGAQAACKKEASAAQTEGQELCEAQQEAREDTCKLLGEAAYDPQINPAKFVNPAKIGKTVVPNPFFPLVRGRTWYYKGGTQTITVTVTGDTREILGVTCAVVRDVVKDNGAVIEDTIDWYAQDVNGNVWYFGESTQEFEDGVLARIDGSWMAGMDHAKPGLIMKAIPAVGNVYRQEFSLGNAEDMAEILDLNGSATVPAASCVSNCLVTKEFTPVEPDLLEHKYYAHGIGFILEIEPATGERLELVKIKY